MDKNPTVRFILGSTSDRDAANVMLAVLNELKITVKISVASCHWHTDADNDNALEDFVFSVEEDIIACIGGMQFNLPGIVDTLNKVNGLAYKIVVAIATDKVAKHANEDFPFGVVVFTAGYNSLKPEVGCRNSALSIAKLLAYKYPQLRKELQSYFNNFRSDKPLLEEVKLSDDGFIPKL